MVDRHRKAVRARSLENIAQHVHVKIVEVILQLILVIAERSQVVHLFGGKNDFAQRAN
jgi:hypothetical protein